MTLLYISKGLGQRPRGEEPWEKCQWPSAKGIWLGAKGQGQRAIGERPGSKCWWKRARGKGLEVKGLRQRAMGEGPWAKGRGTEPSSFKDNDRAMEMNSNLV